MEQSLEKDKMENRIKQISTNREYIKKFKEKYPNMILLFEKETGKKATCGNKLSRNFVHWFERKTTIKIKRRLK